jgi:hypothetical protein
MNPTGRMQGASLLNNLDCVDFGHFVTISFFNISNDWGAAASSNIAPSFHPPKPPKTPSNALYWSHAGGKTFDF